MNNGFRPWQPNANRRPPGYVGRPGTNRPAGADFGYAGKPGANQLPRGQAGNGNALSGYGRGSTTLQNSARGQQSLSGANRGGTSGANRGGTTSANRGGTIPAYKPPANRPTTKPPQARTQNLNRGGNAGSVFGGSRNGGFDRSASQRGGNSMRSAQRSGFKRR